MAGNAKPYVLGESSVPHKVGLLHGTGGELVYDYYFGIYPNGSRIPEHFDNRKVSKHFVVVPGIIMKRTGLEDRVLMCGPVPLNQREEVKVLISGELKLLPRDIRFVFW
ncbi:MAG: hypothetical protein HY438_04255 [DPANN group archaeon]|nr:hypothetical protein [DPANN group archaeon]